MLKTYKTIGGAQRAADGKPIIRIGSLYIVGCDETGLTEVEIISPKSEIVGHITMRHLNQIGNGNYAPGHPEWGSTDFVFE